MPLFTEPAIRAIRGALRSKWSMKALCAAMCVYDRDEVVEAIDAVRRWPDNQDALWHVNRVLSFQAQGQPLINGNPAHLVMRDWRTAAEAHG